MAPKKPKTPTDPNFNEVPFYNLIDEKIDKITKQKNYETIATYMYRQRKALFWDFFQADPENMENFSAPRYLFKLQDLGLIPDNDTINGYLNKILDDSDRRSYYMKERGYIIYIVSKNIYDIVKNIDPMTFNNVPNYIDVFKTASKYINQPTTFIRTLEMFIDDYTEYQRELLNPAPLPSYDYKPLYDIETMAKMTGDDEEKAYYTDLINQRTKELRDKSFLMDEEKVKAINKWKLEGGEITIEEFEKIIQEIRKDPTYKLTPIVGTPRGVGDIAKNAEINQYRRQLQELNDMKLKKFIQDYEAKRDGIIGVGSVPTSTNKKIYDLLNVGLNKIDTVKAEKVKRGVVQMKFTYPYGFPPAEIKLENASYNVYQDDKPPKKFGIRYDLAKKWALEGGYYEKDLKIQNRLRTLQSEDSIYRNRKFQWKINH